MRKEFRKIAIEAALRGGIFIKNSVGRVKEVSYKGSDNIVTDVDKKAEDIIIGEILSAFPEHSVLSEENGSRECLSQYRWIIDPLDGTTNFAHGFPFFAVSIALEFKGIIVLGVVYDPVRDELFTAALGHGSRLNRKRIRVSKTKRLKDSFLATGFPYGNDMKCRNLRYFKTFLMECLAIRRAGSAALDLCYVANGRFDGFWEMNLHPWDSAAGSLIVREAGGVITRFDNKDYSHYDNELLATNTSIHNEMINILSKKAVR